MSPKQVGSSPDKPYRLTPQSLRWRCAPTNFAFKTTDDLDECPIQIIGQNRAMEALRLGLTMKSEGYNIFVTGDVGSGRSTVVRRMLDALPEDRYEAALIVRGVSS